jgi:hypothetical protein
LLADSAKERRDLGVRRRDFRARWGRSCAAHYLSALRQAAYCSSRIAASRLFT